MWGGKILQNSISNSPIIGFRLRKFILGLLGHKICMLYPHCFIGWGKGRIYMGKGTFANSHCFFDTSNDIIIGDNVSIAMKVNFITSSHEIGNDEKRAKGAWNKPIVVEDGCWIGACVTILPGVTIGKGCVIAAGAVVTKDCSKNGLYAGLPAVRVKDL